MLDCTISGDLKMPPDFCSLFNVLVILNDLEQRPCNLVLNSTVPFLIQYLEIYLHPSLS